MDVRRLWIVLNYFKRGERRGEDEGHCTIVVRYSKGPP
jgi:hypothetical protein